MRGFRRLIHSRPVVRVRIALLTVALILFVSLFFIGWQEKLLVMSLILSLYSLTYVWICSRVLETGILTVRTPVSRLVEGDWLVAEVRKNGRVLVRPKNTGLTRQQIAILKRHKVRRVLVREGIPFVPSFLLALLVQVLLGGRLLALLSS